MQPEMPTETNRAHAILSIERTNRLVLGGGLIAAQQFRRNAYLDIRSHEFNDSRNRQVMVTIHKSQVSKYSTSAHATGCSSFQTGQSRGLVGQLLQSARREGLSIWRRRDDCDAPGTVTHFHRRNQGHAPRVDNRHIIGWPIGGIQISIVRA